MIYINEMSGTISIPKHTTASGHFNLVLTSPLSDTVTLVANGEDISTNDLYYKLTLSSLSDLNVGEYQYSLFEVDNPADILEVGLLTFGEYSRNIVQNIQTKRNKVQYNG